MVKHSNNQSGFAHVEAILIAVIISIIGGVGYYVFKQNHTTVNIPNTSNTAYGAQTGTLAAVDSVNQKDLDEELNAEDALATQEQKDADTEAAALNSAAEGYDVNF